MVHAGNSTKEVRQNAVAPLSANQKGVLSNDMQKRTPSGLNSVLAPTPLPPP